MTIIETEPDGVRDHELPPIGTLVTVEHQGPDGRLHHIGTLAARTGDGWDFTLWLDPPHRSVTDHLPHEGPFPVPCESYPIEARRVERFSPKLEDVETARRVDEFARGLDRLADIVRRHPDLIDGFGLREFTVYGIEADHPLRAELGDGQTLELADGMKLDLYRSTAIDA